MFYSSQTRSRKKYAKDEPDLDEDAVAEHEEQSKACEIEKAGQVLMSSPLRMTGHVTVSTVRTIGDTSKSTLEALI